jgi:hypothetical protein
MVDVLGEEGQDPLLTAAATRDVVAFHELVSPMC